MSSFTGALLIFRSATWAASPPGAADVRRAVDQVFSDPELAGGLEASQGEGYDLLRIIQEWLMGILIDLLEYLAGLHIEHPLLFYAIIGSLLAILLAILIHMGWAISLAFRGIPRADPEAGEGEGAERTRRFREIRDEARRLSSEGRHREGIRMLLLALFSLVEERKVLRVARGWTNREILSRLRLGTEAAAGLEGFGEAFEETWYGGAASGRGEFERCDGLLEEAARGLVPGGDGLDRAGPNSPPSPPEGAA